MDLSLKKTYIMGILNITPDSFSDGGQYIHLDQALAHAEQMIAEGADIIDIGGESSRPGAAPVPEAEELDRVIPLIDRLKKLGVPISIDTYKPRVAALALEHGATILNDITGLQNPDMVKVVARFHAPVILMHMRGTPQTMQQNPAYSDVITDIKTFFKKQLAIAHAAGITDIILDPGLGFGKTLEHNLTILKGLNEFTDLGYPLLIGPSRKSFIGTLTGLPVEDRLEGSIAATVIAALNGAKIIRVHDVKESKRALQIVDAVKNN